MPHAMFVIDRANRDAVFYVNSTRFRFHKDFVNATYLSLERGDAFYVRNYSKHDRRFLLGTVAYQVPLAKYTFEFNGLTEEGTIKVEPGKKPATIDLAITEGDDKGKSQVGIYKVDGDTITVCLAAPGAKDRPTEFKSTEENGHILATIKRAKKDD